MLARLLSLFALVLFLAGPVQAAKRVDLDYHVRFLPEEDQAVVQLILEKGEAVRSLRFNLGDEGYYSDFEADGEWQQGSPAQGTWRPAAGKAKLSYRVRISHPRDNGRFDARMTPDWALFRGDDLVPPARLDQVDGVSLVSRITFELPEGWKSIETGWPRVGKNRFRVDNRERLFDRTLDRGLIGLTLPPGKGRAVIFNFQCISGRGRPANGHPDHADLRLAAGAERLSPRPGEIAHRWRWRSDVARWAVRAELPVHARRSTDGQRERHQLAGT